MKGVFGSTYSASKTAELADYKILEMTSGIIRADSIDEKRFKLLCGTVCYKMLFLIPRYQIEDGRRYTIEECMTFVPGLMKVPLHDILYGLGRIALCTEVEPTLISDVCHESMFPEAVSILKVPSTMELYASLAIMYFHIKGDVARRDQVVALARNPVTDVLKVWEYFESEVFHEGKGLY